MTIPPRERLIVALDLPSAEEALRVVESLGDSAGFYKIGLELVCRGDGLDLAQRLIGDGHKVFIDMKLHDIPNTVEGAAARIATLGATFLTVHAFPKTMQAAKKAVTGSSLRLLGVTVLTSDDDADLAEAGYAFGAADLVRRRAAQARDCGIDGLVMSPHEAAAMRALLGPDVAIVTPGVRPAGNAVGDQKRVMSPGEAIEAGADYLVVGRPITTAIDPRAAAESIQAEIAAAAP